jgi:uncharacterized protein (DUF342 family)
MPSLTILFQDASQEPKKEAFNNSFIVRNPCKKIEKYIVKTGKS